MKSETLLDTGPRLMKVGEPLL